MRRIHEKNFQKKKNIDDGDEVKKKNFQKFKKINNTLRVKKDTFLLHNTYMAACKMRGSSILP